MALPRGVPLALLAAVAAAAALSVPGQAAPPPDAFCVILIEGLDGMRLVRVTVDEETTLGEREELFPQVDADGDGHVTLAENELFQRATMDARNGTFENKTHRLELQGSKLAAPLHTAVWRQVGHTFHKMNHTQPWPVQEPVDLETQQVREASFPLPADVRKVSLFGGLMPPPPQSQTAVTTPEYVVIRAPPGWIVTHVGGSDYQGTFLLAANSSEVDVPAFDTKSPYTITFERQDVPANGTAATTVTQTVTHAFTRTTTVDVGKGTPAVAPAVLALALLAAAAVALRRRL